MDSAALLYAVHILPHHLITFSDTTKIWFVPTDDTKFQINVKQM
jgi:hypothetical protein